MYFRLLFFMCCVRLAGAAHGKMVPEEQDSARRLDCRDLWSGVQVRFSRALSCPLRPVRMGSIRVTHPKRRNNDKAKRREHLEKFNNEKNEKCIFKSR